MFSLNAQSGVPIYRQLMEQIRQLIAGGQLRPGVELPSVRELAMQHAVNPMTISKAYSLLEAEGTLERSRGRPMTVARQERVQESKADRLRRLQPAISHLCNAAKQLSLSPADVVTAVRQALEKDHE